VIAGCSTTRCSAGHRHRHPGRGSGRSSACWPRSSTPTCTWAERVNAIGHHFGRRPYENTAGNLHWLAFMTAGEGFHNNHHAVPTSPRLSHHWYQFDLGWLVIRGLSALGLAKLREPALARIQTAPRRAA
jgi:fatty-acid desaturase